MSLGASELRSRPQSPHLNDPLAEPAPRVLPCMWAPPAVGRPPKESPPLVEFMLHSSDQSFLGGGLAVPPPGLNSSGRAWPSSGGPAPSPYVPGDACGASVTLRSADVQQMSMYAGSFVHGLRSLAGDSVASVPSEGTAAFPAGASPAPWFPRTPTAVKHGCDMTRDAVHELDLLPLLPPPMNKLKNARAAATESISPASASALPPAATIDFCEPSEGDE